MRTSTMRAELRKLKAATGAVPILMNQNDYALLKMLDMQATWVGMKAPGAVQIDETVSQGRILKIGEISSHVIDTPVRTYRRQHLRVYFSRREKLIAGDTLFCRQHWPH